ncbi:MAG: DUF6775 family putative metallopeptidase [Nitrososphaerales archaeon]
MQRVKYVYLYNEPSSKTLNINGVAEYVRRMVNCNVDVRREFFTHFLKHKNIDYVADKIVSTKVLDTRKQFTKHNSLPIEIKFEKKVISTPSKRFLGILYDGFELQRIFNELIPEEENTLEQLHIVFTNRLLCTYGENDSRYHYRTIICGYPTIICTSGIIEAPAKPREFYFLQQLYASIGNTNLDEIKEKFRGRFIDYDDPRFSEVIKGIVLQGLFYHIAGNPFCEKKECILLNAHWQEDLIACQINIGTLCDDHLKILQNFNNLRS